MRECAYRKKNSESTEQADSGNVEVNLEEEDLVVANTDEESQGEGKHFFFNFYLLIYTNWD